MNPHIEKALAYLLRINYAGYFEEMDKVGIPEEFQYAYATNKGMFITGQKPWDFPQTLKTLAMQISAGLEKTPVELKTTKIQVVSDYKSQAYSYLEEGEIGEALKTIIPNTRETEMHPTVIAINVSYKEYEKDKLAGKSVVGQLEDITVRLTKLLEKL